jgi:hypothetical protein
MELSKEEQKSTGNGQNHINGFQLKDTSKGMIINNSDETLYDLWKGIPTNVKHFRVFKRK